MLTYRNGNTDEEDVNGKKALRISDSLGLTWGSEDTLYKYPDYDTRDGGIVNLTINGVETLFHTFYTYDGDGTPRVNTYIQKSIDDGKTWSTPSLLSAGRAHENTIIQLSNGELALATYQPNNPTEVYIEKSTDNGETWTETLVGVSEDIIGNSPVTKNLGESAVIETKDINGDYTGGLFFISRVQGGTNYIAFTSENYGANWSSPIELNSSPFPTTYYWPTKPNLFRLDEDAILCSFTTTDYKIVVLKSVDECQTWTLSMELSSGGSKGAYPFLEFINNEYVGMSWCTNGPSSDLFFNIIPVGLF